MTETASAGAGVPARGDAPVAGDVPAKVATRDRTLFAPAELFRRQGYNGTGLKQVVAEADAPFGSLYHHFPGGKAELGDEVIRKAGTFFQSLVVAVYDDERSPEASVRAVFQ